MSIRFVYHRITLADSIVQGMAGAAIVDYSSGLFLTAPRRTGKSTFLREDLIPACTAQGWETVYVDLWTNRDVSPAILIEKAIATKLIEHQTQIQKLFTATGANKITLLRSISWDLTTSALPDEATLADALQLLYLATDRMVVLIVDEAQHALNSDAGMNSMFALKAARDALNQGETRPGLRLVFTGSSRDKLAQLVLNTKQPFFGAQITPFPLLGRDFVEAYTEDLNTKLAERNRFQVDAMYRAFELVGNRPELLASIVSRIALEMGEAPNLGDLLESNAHAFQQELWGEYSLSFDPLPNIQKAVLKAVARSLASREPFAAYKEETVKLIARLAREQNPECDLPTAQHIQQALEALRTKELIWRVGRGMYALEDEGMADWLASQAEDAPKA
ncbi:hypothetical protein ELY33_07270 [Vreelandella andesensis]|uniref:ATP-binding protein n=1 Tax=Vreelandella andesensis TaxID=447567 RepID=A0A3S0W520_9GAMM|nr:hypothetical protein [Halomonas andesensis]RUR31852.1 hypothetical protein ELY33_07270 [Halomonas andesensis]